METRFKILDFATYIVGMCHRKAYTISPLKLQKLLYYIQSWYAVYLDCDESIFNETPQAWANGPVYPQVYTEYKHIQRIGMYDQIPKPDIQLEELKNTLSLTEKEEELVNDTVLAYGQFNHDKLVFMTHCEDPWINARQGLPPYAKCSNEITVSSMKEYFSKRLENHNKNENTDS